MAGKRNPNKIFESEDGVTVGAGNPAKIGGKRKFDAERNGRTHKFVIYSNDENGTAQRYKGYLVVNLFDDGSIGEIFIHMDKVGSMIRGFMESWGVQVSKRLQAGVSIEEIIREHRGTSFIPSGRTETPGIRTCSSPLDYVARYLDHRYVKGLPLKDGAE